MTAFYVLWTVLGLVLIGSAWLGWRVMIDEDELKDRRLASIRAIREAEPECCLICAVDRRIAELGGEPSTQQHRCAEKIAALRPK